MTEIYDADAGRRFRFGSALLVAALGYYAMSSATLLPALVGQWMTRAHISEADAGLIATGSLICQTLGLLVGMAGIGRRSLATIAMTGLLLAMPADLMSIFAATHDALLGWRSASGMGCGLILAAVVNWFARQPAPDKYFAVFVTLQFLMPVPILLALPAISALLGDAIIYACMLAIGLASLPALRLLQHRQPEAARSRDGSGALGGGNSPIKIMAVSASALFNGCVVGAWAFLVPYSQRAGIDPATGMQAIALSSAFGVPGSFLVTRLRPSLGRFVPLALSLSGLAALFLWLGHSTPGAASFYIQVILLNLLWAFTAPIIQGTQAAIDRTGALPVWGAIAASVGSGLGPGLLGQAIHGGGFALPFTLMAGGIALTALFILPAAWRASGASRQVILREASL